jgi:dienelactone hydrolase
MKSRSLLPSALIIFLFLASNSYSQVQTPRPVSISSSCGGYYEYLPQGYSANTTQTYPLIVFIHGIGEQGNGTTDLGNILNCWTSLPRLIANGGFPTSFNVGGQNFSFIVISPQFNRWPYASDVNSVVDYAIKNYRVDQSRIYVTGLSMGGGSVWDFAGNFPTKAAAIVPICGAASADVTRSQAIANAKLPVWATHNSDDPTVPSYNTTGWVSMITQYGGDIQSTIFQASGHDAWSRTYDPNFTQNGVNIYQWMLQHQRGNTPPPPPPNQSPTANAGNDQTVTLPQNSVTLAGSGTDPDGTISFYEWSQTSGPSQALIVSPYSANTVINNLAQGSYVFSLKVTDDKGATAVNNITITVNAASPPPNQSPTANAGNDQVITLPANLVILFGSGFDSDGTISSYRWTQVSGPSQANMRSSSSAATIADSLKQGIYSFRLTVSDDKGATAWDEVRITVNRPPNQLPIANAGPDQIITLPDNSIKLSGLASDADGAITSFSWTQTSGPTKSSFSSASPLAITVRNLIQGIYTFRLTVTDNDGATIWDEVKVTVMADPRTQSTAIIYPNPATDMIYVKIDALTLQSNSTINIRNAAGSVVYTDSFLRTNFRILKQIDISKLPSGIYYLSVTADIHTNKTLTFIKQ